MHTQQQHAWRSNIRSSTAAATYLAGARCYGEVKVTTGAAGAAAGAIGKLGDAATQAAGDAVDAGRQSGGIAIATCD